MKTVLTNENTFTVSHIGSALEADKKINLALKIPVIVHALEAPRTTAQGRPLNVRRDGLLATGRLSLARSTGPVWTPEFGLYPLESLVVGCGVTSSWYGTAKLKSNWSARLPKRFVFAQRHVFLVSNKGNCI